MKTTYTYKCPIANCGCEFQDEVEFVDHITENHEVSNRVFAAMNRILAQGEDQK